MVDTTPQKLCLRCKIVKPVDQFSPNRSVKSGLASWCRSCHREYGRALRYDADPAVREKCCTRCRSVKSIDQFNRNRQNRDGFQSACKSCQQERHREWYVRNSESVIARTRQWAADNPEKAKAAAARGQRRRLYSLSPSEYDQLMQDQLGKCGACGDCFGTTSPHVDHDHETGEVRGLLCGNCNRALGLLLDSPERVGGLARYLRRSRLRVIAGG